MNQFNLADIAPPVNKNLSESKGGKSNDTALSDFNMELMASSLTPVISDGNGQLGDVGFTSFSNAMGVSIRSKAMELGLFTSPDASATNSNRAVRGSSPANASVQDSAGRGEQLDSGSLHEGAKKNDYKRRSRSARQPSAGARASSTKTNKTDTSIHNVQSRITASEADTGIDTSNNLTNRNDATAKKADGAGFQNSLKASGLNPEALPGEALKLETALMGSQSGASKAGSGALQVNGQMSLSTAGDITQTATGPTTAVATTRATPGVKAASMPKAAFDYSLLKQIGIKISVAFKDDFGKATIDLSPPDLGKLKVDITVDKNKVKAVIATQNPVVKDLLEANLVQLKHSLMDQGLLVDEVSISLDNGPKQFNDGTGNDFKKSGGGGAKGAQTALGSQGGGIITSLKNGEVDIFI